MEIIIHTTDIEHQKIVQNVNQMGDLTFLVSGSTETLMETLSERTMGYIRNYLYTANDSLPGRRNIMNHIVQYISSEVIHTRYSSVYGLCVHIRIKATSKQVISLFLETSNPIAN